MNKFLILILFLIMAPEVGQTKSYRAKIYYPHGEGPFSVIILSHGRGGDNFSYKKIAEIMVEQGYAAIVLDHYSARGSYGVKFRNFPYPSVGKSWREKDILDLLRDLKYHSKIDQKKVILAGWSAGAGIVLPFITNPRSLSLPVNVVIVGAILTYPYTYGCYEKIKMFNVPVLIHFGKRDGNNKNKLTGIHCWQEKIRKLENSINPLFFKKYDETYHGYDLIILRNRPKKCRMVKYKYGKDKICLEFNEMSFNQTMMFNKKFLKKYLRN